jgi:hypothetical protein
VRRPSDLTARAVARQPDRRWCHSALREARREGAGVPEDRFVDFSPGQVVDQRRQLVLCRRDRADLYVDQARSRMSR